MASSVSASASIGAPAKSAIASDEAKGFKDTLAGTLPARIMGMYAPEAIPVMSALARGFAVCDCWFAPAPTQTIPNRALAGAATSLGRLDNHVKVFTCDSIFGRLSRKNIDWAIYGYDRAPLTRMDFPDTLHADASHFGHFHDFKQRAAAGKLPTYTFLEPSFGASGNSQHPNYDVAAGEQLMRDVYYALRSNADAWDDTLLVITYDEHGGNYDHVAPPKTARPDDSVGEFDSFDFTRAGVRVPALLISPRIEAGTVFHPSAHVDHTSTLRTIEEQWGLDALTKRDAAAASLSELLTLERARTDDPLERIQAPAMKLVHPLGARPSAIEKIHASRVSQLPLPDAHGHFRHEMPELRTSADAHDYIEGRMARWDAHLVRHPRSRSGQGRAR